MPSKRQKRLRAKERRHLTDTVQTKEFDVFFPQETNTQIDSIEAYEVMRNPVDHEEISINTSVREENDKGEDSRLGDRGIFSLEEMKNTWLMEDNSKINTTLESVVAATKIIFENREEMLRLESERDELLRSSGKER